MKFSKLIAAMAARTMISTGASAQVFKGLGERLVNRAKNAVENKAYQATSKAVNKATDKLEDAVENAAHKGISSLPAGKGKTYYVSVSTGSGRADGLSPATAMRDLQKAIDTAEDNDIILVAEGNYLGNLDRGYIECGRFGDSSHSLGKFISIYGGYSTDFSQRDVLKYITKLQPKEQQFVAPLFNINARRPNGYTGPMGNVVVDGLTFDFGENNLYCVANVNDDRTGTPNEGVLTGRFIEPGASAPGPKVGYANGDEYALHLDVEGNVRIANCVFVNCRDYGIAGLMGKGHMEICNNIFISCRYSACQVRGNVRDADIDKVSLDFHHNTVLFTWTRTKVFDDMGQGFRFMNGIRTINVHNNIIGCSSNCGVERVYYESNKQMEAAKISNLYDNYFFANKRDLEIAAPGAATISVPASRIDEAEQIGPKYEGNKELPKGNDAFINAIDPSYLEGFLGLKIMASQSYDPNSAANQVNRAFGLNQQGTEIVRPSMYCNKYPWEKAKDLFGKIPGYGAQMPK